MKVLERKALKQRITNLALEQFGDLLKEVRFSDPLKMRIWMPILFYEKESL